MEYPKREPFFSHRFTRLLAKCCVANEIGPAATLMLSFIVQTEDAAHYRRGVTYYDSQLMILLGINSSATMCRMRKKAIDSGWLHFQPGRKGKASTYWVLIPERAEGIDDTPTDEGIDSTLVLKSEAQVKRNESANETQAKRNDNESGVLLPNPNPIPNEIDASEITVEATEEKTQSEDVATIARDFWFRLPGTFKPPLDEWVHHFSVKIGWYQSQGHNYHSKILDYVRSKNRDPTKATTINQMWKFWQDFEKQYGLEKSNGRKRAVNSRDSGRSAGGGRYEGLQPRMVNLDS